LTERIKFDPSRQAGCYIDLGEGEGLRWRVVSDSRQMGLMPGVFCAHAVVWSLNRRELPLPN
jgi:hypothetical protein